MRTLTSLIDSWSGEGTLSTKNWERIAPFTGKFTKIKVDYLRILETID